LSIAVWQWVFPPTADGIKSPFTLPYTVQSPITYEQRRFETIDDIWNEIELVCQECEPNRFSVGQNLHFNIPLFCNPQDLIEDWMNEMINDYCYCQRFNLSLGTLDQADSDRLACFAIIENEYQAAMKHKEKQDA
jgi:hypothetical protein